jgi:hypothetical protein
MSISEMAGLIGKTALLRIESFQVNVRINDVRKVWNRIDCFVEPVSGYGEKWVSYERLYQIT